MAHNFCTAGIVDKALYDAYWCSLIKFEQMDLSERIGTV